MFRTFPTAPIFPEKNDIANGSSNKKIDVLNQFRTYVLLTNFVLCFSLYILLF